MAFNPEKYYDRWDNFLDDINKKYDDKIIFEGLPSTILYTDDLDENECLIVNLFFITQPDFYYIKKLLEVVHLYSDYFELIDDKKCPCCIKEKYPETYKKAKKAYCLSNITCNCMAEKLDDMVEKNVINENMYLVLMKMLKMLHARNDEFKEYL